MQLELPHYLAIAGGAAVVVAFLAYFLGGKQVKISATVFGVVAGLALGVGAGMLIMVQTGYSLNRPGADWKVGIEPERRASSWTPPAGVSGVPKMEMPPGMKMPQGGFGGPPSGRPSQPEPAKDK